MHYLDADYIYKDRKIQKDTENYIRAEIKKWQAGHLKEDSQNEDSYNVMYHLKPLKSQSSRRKLTTQERLDLKRMISKLSRITKMEKYLKEMKIALQKNIRALEKIKEQEERKESKLSEAEKRWSIELQSRISPGSYRPLELIGGESHFYK